MKDFGIKVLLCIFGIVGLYLAIPETKEPLKKIEAKTEDIICLAKNIYHEARGESFIGQAAVAFVTLNRVKSPGFPSSVCKVVYSNNAFSWTILHKTKPIRDGSAWEKAVRVARLALQDEITDPTSGATHYHATYVKPYWSKKLTKLIRIDNHIFYS